VAAGGERKRYYPLTDLIKVDGHGNRLGFRRRRWFGCVGFWLRCDLFFIAFRRQRRWIGLFQNDRINAACRLKRVAGHIEPTGGRTVVRAGCEIKVLAVSIKGGVASVTEAVG